MEYLQSFYLKTVITILEQNGNLMKIVLKTIKKIFNKFKILINQTRVNYDENKVPKFDLPDPLLTEFGDRIIQSEDWMKIKRLQIIHMFECYIFGYCPQVNLEPQYILRSSDSSALNKMATRKQITIIFKHQEIQQSINLLIYLPNNKPRPVPVILGYNFYGNHTIHPDPGIYIFPQIKKNEFSSDVIESLSSEKTRGTYYSRWPVEIILESGFGLATAYYGDVEPDFPGGWQYGVRKIIQAGLEKNPDCRNNDKHWNLISDWGAIGVWAWGLSRIMDYLGLDNEICTDKVIVIGHSRLGKAALWAGAQDERFAIVISNNSGCGGAALFRRRFGETIKLINKRFPHWFCENFKNYGDREDQLPVDQHMLLALIAPRPIYVASAEEDLESDPKGEFLAAKYCSSVYELFGLPGLSLEKMPRTNEPCGEYVRYHIRNGKHDITNYDWNEYLYCISKHINLTKSK